MHKRRSALTHRKQRSVLTDMLPFEVPPTFSNRGFYRFLRDNGIEIDGKSLSWNCDTAALDPIVALVFGIKALSKITHETLTQWGKTRTRRSIPLNGCRLDTIPFNFSVAHNLDGRTLSVIHPRNQVEVAGFYANHSALIVYYSSVSDFSIRRPVSVSRFAYFKDKLHVQSLEALAGGIEVEEREYEQLGSYFVSLLSGNFAEGVGYRTDKEGENGF